MSETTEDDSSFQKKITKFIKLGVIFHIIILSVLSFSRLAFPYNICYDAFNWIPAAHLLEGKNPYSYAFTEPYSMNPYGIIYYILLAVGIKIFGFQLWWGKLLSVVAFAACLRFAVKIARSLEVSWRGVLIVLSAGLAMYPAQVMLGCSRASDLIATAFALASLFFVLQTAEDTASRLRKLLFVTLTVSAAYFTKQTFILPFFIVLLRYAQLRKVTDALIFAVACLAVIFGGNLLLDYTSGGGYYWQHYTYAQTLPFAFSEVFLRTLTAFTSPSFLFALIFIGFYLLLGRREVSRRRFLGTPEFLLLAYLTLSISQAALMTGRVGGDVNYFIEGSCLLAIYCGIAYDKWIADDFREMVIAMIVLFTVGNGYQFARAARGEYTRHQSRTYYDEVSGKTRAFISPQSVCVSVYPELVVWNGCRFDFDDFSNYSVGWSPRLRQIFEHEIKRGKYDVLIWDNEYLSDEFPNYQIIPLETDLPSNSMQIFLYARKDLLRR